MSAAPAGLLLETLRLGKESPGDLAGRWRDAPSDGLERLVAYEGAEVWLYRRLSILGALAGFAKERVEAFKQTAYADVALRMRVEQAALEVLDLLAARGIPVVLIKGMARRAMADRYPYLDARGTVDVDLLVEPSRSAEARQWLLDSGYEDVPVAEAAVMHFHHQAVWNRQRVAVELHWSTSTTEPGEDVWRRFYHQGVALEWEGRPVRVPPPTELAWHALHHAVTPSDSIVVGFRLKHFLEVAALVSAGAPVDWDELSRRAAQEPVLEPASGRRLPGEILARWLSAARWLGGDPAGSDCRPFDLEGLLAWRWLVLRSRNRLGRAVTTRLLEEGPRSVIGERFEPAPAGIDWARRLRRGTASFGARVAFRTWRATTGP